MPYVQPWDETTPDGAVTPANTIDTIIINLETAIRERLQQVIPGFGNDLVDPKVLAVQSGVEANRPAVQSVGHVYFATDTGRLWLGKADGTWVDIRETSFVLVDVAASIPNPPKEKGILFYATDTKELSVSVPAATAGDFVWEVVFSPTTGLTNRSGLNIIDALYVVQDSWAVGTSSTNRYPLFTNLAPNAYSLFQVRSRAKVATEPNYGLGWAHGVGSALNLPTAPLVAFKIRRVYTEPDSIDPAREQWMVEIERENGTTGAVTVDQQIELHLIKNT